VLFVDEGGQMQSWLRHGVSFSPVVFYLLTISLGCIFPVVTVKYYATITTDKKRMQ
jgi:hypothetical protein